MGSALTAGEIAILSIQGGHILLNLYTSLDFHIFESECCHGCCWIRDTVKNKDGAITPSASAENIANTTGGNTSPRKFNLEEIHVDQADHNVVYPDNYLGMFKPTKTKS
jgi:hypothetical protein